MYLSIISKGKTQNYHWVFSFNYLSDKHQQVGHTHYVYIRKEKIMEHIVQFAICIDDEAIRQRVIESAYNDVVKQLMEEAKRDVGLSRGYYRPKDTWSSIIDHALRNYFDENKDLIINLAAEKLADSYKRTKAFKEKMGAALDESSTK